MKKYSQPYNWYFGLAVVLLLLFLFPHFREGALDLSLDDTYVVIGYDLLIPLLTIVVALAGLVVYWLRLIQNKLSKLIYFLHLLLTVIGILALLFPQGAQPTITDNSAYELFDRNPINFTSALLLTALFAQLLYGVNTIVLIFRNLFKK